jgi:ATP phosphoribosyltransferase regulatory subunit HisZ
MKTRSLAAIAAVLVLVGGTGSPLRSAPDDDSRYAKVAQAYFYENFAANPVNATFTGVHTYDSQLGRYGPREYATQLARDKRYLVQLAQIDPTQLSPDVALDRAMLAMICS